MKGNTIIITSSMRHNTLSCLHDEHQGITSTLQWARCTVYWPKLQDDISVGDSQRKNVKTVKGMVTGWKLLPWINGPMETIAMDQWTNGNHCHESSIKYQGGYAVIMIIFPGSSHTTPLTCKQAISERSAWDQFQKVWTFGEGTIRQWPMQVRVTIKATVGQKEQSRPTSIFWTKGKMK